MSTDSTRIIKEARALIVPWCVVTAACAFPLLTSFFGNRMNGETVRMLAIALGIPFLTCSSYGNEFRHKTMELLLSQPVHRMTIWREKALVAAIATAASVFVAFLPLGSMVAPRATIFYFAAYLIVMNCSATYWTLIARSTLSGLALNAGALLLLFIAVSASFKMLSLNILIPILLGYSALMLWLGWRKLARFQLPGGFGGTDLMTVSPNVLPARIASWFRCRSNQLFLNVIRKELHLLRPLWVVAAFFVPVYSALAVSATIVPISNEWKEPFRVCFAIFSALYLLISMLLAGGVSLSEEQESGLFAWHRTLPFSMRFHWLIKLLIGLTAGLACAAALPALMLRLGHAVLGPDFAELVRYSPTALPIWALVTVGLLGFWCANAVEGMTRATILLAAVAGMLSVAYGLGGFAAYYFEGVLGHLSAFAISVFQLNPVSVAIDVSALGRSRNTDWLIIPPVAFATIQSYFMFRRLPQRGIRKLAQRIFPMLALAFVMTVVVNGSQYFHPEYVFFQNIGQAVVQFQPGIAKHETIQPITFTDKDLVASSSLPAGTARWLRNSTMTLASSERREGLGTLANLSRISPVYVVTIILPNGTKCRMSFVRTVDVFPQSNDTKNVWVFSRDCE